jgi:hypothetical protein
MCRFSAKDGENLMTLPQMSFLFRLLLTIGCVCLLVACSFFSERSLTITPDEIPIYGSAQNVQRTGPTPIYLGEKYTWTFITTDLPKDVWQFYVDEMSQRWNFYDAQPTNPERVLIVRSCPFYYIKMDSKTNDYRTYNITITFSKEGCR